jgi:uncharacterized RDD family membrane protein YckC
MQTRSDSNIYAGFFVRFAAYLADSIIASILSLTLVSPLYAAKAAGMDFLGKNILFNFTIINIISYLLFVAYFVLLTYFGHSTPGKKLFRLEVITEDGEWNIINILYRETVGRFLSGLMNIGYLAIIVTDKKQGFHDKLCDTCVIYKGAVLSEDEILKKEAAEQRKKAAAEAAAQRQNAAAAAAQNGNGAQAMQSQDAADTIQNSAEVQATANDAEATKAVQNDNGAQDAENEPAPADAASEESKSEDNSDEKKD